MEKLHSPLPREFFEREPLEVALDLMGTHLLWNGCSGRIAEVEAYQTEGDEACHTFFRPSTRLFVEKHPPGTAYVYLNYGVHWLFNVLCKAGDIEGFVLVRALEPLSGIEVMQERRQKTRQEDLCSGPGKLTRALAITGEDHGLDLPEEPSCSLHYGRSPLPLSGITADVRIGISRAADLPWRFLLPKSPHLSVKPTAAAFPLPINRRVAVRRLKALCPKS